MCRTARSRVVVLTSRRNRQSALDNRQLAITIGHSALGEGQRKSHGSEDGLCEVKSLGIAALDRHEELNLTILPIPDVKFRLIDPHAIQALPIAADVGSLAAYPRKRFLIIVHPLLLPLVECK